MKRQLDINITYDDEKIKEIVDKVISRRISRMAKKITDSKIRNSLYKLLREEFNQRLY